MTKTIQLHLFGQIEIRVDPPGSQRSLRRKPRALLTYLVITNRPHTRQFLSDLFCQEAKDPSAVLRTLLSRIRRELGADFLRTEGATITFDRQATWIDYDEFVNSLDSKLDNQSLNEIRNALKLYRGELMAGFSLPDAPAFELWLLGERARLRQLYERRLAELVSRLIAAKRFDEALLQAQQLLNSNPLLEEAHAHLIWLYARTGQRDAALQQYEQCQQLLLEGLAVEPMAELQSLHAEIEAGQVRPEFQLASPTVTTTETTIGATPDFVSRAAELTQLSQRWQTAVQGSGSVVLIQAEAGGGKTRLVQEFGRQQPASRILTGTCYESTRSLPYHPWIELLETHLADVDETAHARWPPFWHTYLARLLPSLAARHQRTPLPAPTGSETERLFTAIADLLLSDTASSPILIFIDNLQWADEASLQLFHFLARRLANAAGLLVGTYRREEIAETAALEALLSDLGKVRPLRLTLPPLRADSVAVLAEQLWPNLADGYRPHVVQMLTKATGGNPLFLTEVLRELAHTQELPKRLPVPQNVHDLTQRRLRKLPESSRQVLEAIAILDAPTNLATAQQISGRNHEEAFTAIDLGLRRGLLLPVAKESGRYAFNHDLVREAVAAQLSYIRQQRLHYRAAELLEQSRVPAATVAYHWRMAGEPDKEGHFAALAGENAAAVFAFDEAVHYLTRAVEIIKEPSRHADLCHQLADIYSRIGRWSEAETILLRAQATVAKIVDETEKVRFEMKIMALLGSVWIWQGKWSEAEVSFKEALTRANALADLREKARIQGAIGQIMTRKGLQSEALNWLTDAYTSSLAANDKLGMARNIGVKGIVYFWMENHKAANDCFEQALQLATELKDKPNIAVWLGNMGALQHELEKLPEALAYYEQALQIHRELGIQMQVGLTLGNLGDVHRDMGHYSQALEVHLTALDIRLQLGDKAGIATTLSTLAEDYLALAGHEAARLCLLQALQIDLELESRIGTATQLESLGRVYFEVGWLEKSLAAYERALLLLEGLEKPSLLEKCVTGKAATVQQQAEPLPESTPAKPSSLPALPNFVTEQPVEFTAVLAQVDTWLASLTV